MNNATLALESETPRKQTFSWERTKQEVFTHLPSVTECQYNSMNKMFRFNENCPWNSYIRPALLLKGAVSTVTESPLLGE